MLLYEVKFLLRQYGFRHVVAKNMEDPLVVDDLRHEGAGNKDSVIADGVHKVLYFFKVGHDIRRDSSSVDRVDLLSLLRIQSAVGIFERSDIADLTVDSRLLKAALKLLELLNRGVFQEIRHDDERILFLLSISTVQGEESLYPGVKQLKRLQLKGLFHCLMRRNKAQRLAHLQIPVHGRRTVRVDLTEAEVTAVLVVEEIQAGNGEISVIGGRQKDQLLQLLGERKEPAVFRVPSVLLDHLVEDPDRGLRDSLELLHRLLIKYLGDLQSLLHHSVVIERGLLQRFFHQKGAFAVFLHVCVNVIFINFVYLILQSHVEPPFICILSLLY